MVDTRNVGGRHALVANAFANGCIRVVDRRSETKISTYQYTIHLVVSYHSRRVIRVGLTDGVLGRVEGGITSLSAVDDHNLSVGHQDEFRHHARLQHVFDLPTLLDTLIGEGHASALIRGGILCGELETWGVCVRGRTTANEDLGDVVGRVEREESGSTIERIGDFDTIRDVRKLSLSVVLDIIDDGLVSGSNPDPTIGEGDSSDNM